MKKSRFLALVLMAILIFPTSGLSSGAQNSWRQVALGVFERQNPTSASRIYTVAGQRALLKIEMARLETRALSLRQRGLSTDEAGRQLAPYFANIRNIERRIANAQLLLTQNSCSAQFGTVGSADVVIAHVDVACNSATQIDTWVEACANSNCRSNTDNEFNTSVFNQVGASGHSAGGTCSGEEQYSYLGQTFDQHQFSC